MLLAALFAVGMPHISQTALELAAYLFLRPLKLLLGRSLLMTLLAAASLVTSFEARLVIIGIRLGEMRLLEPSLIVLGYLFVHATFLHLVLVTVFILVEAFLELMLSFPLGKPDPVLLNQSFDLACGLAVVGNCAISFQLV